MFYRICLEYKRDYNNYKMLWFFIGFIFGLYVAQESPTFPNVKQTFSRMGTFAYEIATNDKTFTATTKQQRSKSE